MLNCDAACTDWSGAQCDGAVWRETRLADSTWTGASGRRPQFIRCDGAPTAIPGLSAEVAPLVAMGAAPSTGHDSPPTAESAPRSPLRLLTGHAGGVSACAFAPDGARLLSAGADGTLRLWDATTGALLRIHAVQSAPWPGHAVWEPPTNRLIEWSGDAWRWLHWVATDADGWPDPLPLETFGDLPRPDPP